MEAARKRIILVATLWGWHFFLHDLARVFGYECGAWVSFVQFFREGFARTAWVFVYWTTTMVETSRVFHCDSGRLFGVRWKCDRGEAEIWWLGLFLTELFDKISFLLNDSTASVCSPLSPFHDTSFRLDWVDLCWLMTNWLILEKIGRGGYDFIYPCFWRSWGWLVCNRWMCTRYSLDGSNENPRQRASLLDDSIALACWINRWKIENYRGVEIY